MSERRYQIDQRLRPAMLALRDTEDYSRLELRDDLLADRIREIYEALTEDVLEGRTSLRTRAWRARAWDRLCVLRGRDPHDGAAASLDRLYSFRKWRGR